MIKYSNEQGFIKPEGIKFRDGQNAEIKIPKVAIGVFSRHLLNEVVNDPYFKSREIGYTSTANFEKNVYIIKYNEVEFTFFMAGVSAPLIASDIEELHKQGVEKFIIFGSCGVLDSSIADCAIIIPTSAFREDGTSYHYAPCSEQIDLNIKYQEEFVDILDKLCIKYHKGITWTTDAFYRETKEKVEYFKSKGAITVEMEGATIGAVSQFLNVDAFTFYYAADNLDSTEWDQRSLSGKDKLDEKKKVIYLALELGIKINDEMCKEN